MENFYEWNVEEKSFVGGAPHIEGMNLADNLLAYIELTKVPYQYAMCLNRECSKANTCLRLLTAQSVPEKIEYWVIISPKHLAAQQGNCPYYRSNVKVRYAKGFIRMLEDLPYKQMQTVISHLMSYFGRRTYYRIRKGERLLTPSEQQRILNILKNCGATHLQNFDAYVEDYDW